MPGSGGGGRFCYRREKLVMIKVIERFQTLRQQEETLNLYALVDGFQYEQHTGQRIEHQRGANRSILHGTEDEPLAHAGP